MGGVTTKEFTVSRRLGFAPPPVTRRPGPWDSRTHDYYINCRQLGESASYDAYTSRYWPVIGTTIGAGYVSNVFLAGPDKLPGVPSCS